MIVNAFIASRLGSTRVPFKNVRLLAGKPMYSYLISTCLDVTGFTQLYLNSDSQKLLNIACSEFGSKIEYFKRENYLGTSKATLDDYVYDFMQKVSGDITVFINPCSIFLQSKTIETALEYFINNDLDSCVASEVLQTHGFYLDKPINFSFQEKQPRSQDLYPLHAMTSGFFIWRNETFCDYFLKYGRANFCGKFSSFGISKIEAIDIDTDEDFLIAELLLNGMKLNNSQAIKYHPSFHDDILSGDLKPN